MGKNTWNDIYKKKGKVQKRIYNIVKESVRILRKNKASKVLDLGCGTGRHTVFLATRGFRVYGLDISQSGIDYIKIAKKKLGLRNIILKRADMAKIPYKDGFFDCVICTSVINHAKISKIRRTFREIERVLKYNGILVFHVVSRKDFASKTGKEIEPGTLIGIDDWDSDVPHHYFSKKELKNFLRNFNILKFEEGHRMSERLNKRRDYWEIIGVRK